MVNWSLPLHISPKLPSFRAVLSKFVAISTQYYVRGDLFCRRIIVWHYMGLYLIVPIIDSPVVMNRSPREPLILLDQKKF